MQSFTGPELQKTLNFSILPGSSVEIEKRQALGVPRQHPTFTVDVAATADAGGNEGRINAHIMRCHTPVDNPLQVLKLLDQIDNSSTRVGKWAQIVHYEQLSSHPIDTDKILEVHKVLLEDEKIELTPGKTSEKNWRSLYNVLQVISENIRNSDAQYIFNLMARRFNKELSRRGRTNAMITVAPSIDRNDFLAEVRSLIVEKLRGNTILEHPMWDSTLHDIDQEIVNILFPKQRDNLITPDHHPEYALSCQDAPFYDPETDMSKAAVTTDADREKVLETIFAHRTVIIEQRAMVVTNMIPSDVYTALESLDAPPVYDGRIQRFREVMHHAAQSSLRSENAIVRNCDAVFSIVTGPDHYPVKIQRAMLGFTMEMDPILLPYPTAFGFDS